MAVAVVVVSGDSAWTSGYVGELIGRTESTQNPGKAGLLNLAWDTMYGAARARAIHREPQTGVTK